MFASRLPDCKRKDIDPILNFEKEDARMSEKTEVLFMQVRLLRLASEEWNLSLQKVSELFANHRILKFIEDCYDVFHMEGDRAVLEEIQKVLQNKGVNLNA